MGVEVAGHAVDGGRGEMPVFEADEPGAGFGEVEGLEDLKVVALGVQLENVEGGQAVTGDDVV